MAISTGDVSSSLASETIILPPKTLTGHTKLVNSIALSTDNDRVVSGSSDKTVRVWSISSGACVREFKGHTSNVYGVALGFDNDRVVSWGWR